MRAHHHISRRLLRVIDAAAAAGTAGLARKRARRIQLAAALTAVALMAIAARAQADTITITGIHAADGQVLATARATATQGSFAAATGSDGCRPSPTADQYQPTVTTDGQPGQVALPYEPTPHGVALCAWITGADGRTTATYQRHIATPLPATAETAAANASSTRWWWPVIGWAAFPMFVLLVFGVFALPWLMAAAVARLIMRALHTHDRRPDRGEHRHLQEAQAAAQPTPTDNAARVAGDPDPAPAQALAPLTGGVTPRATSAGPPAYHHDPRAPIATQEIPIDLDASGN